MATETATLGGGCFWCIEAVFEQLKGVQKVESGYAGGQTSNPTYRDVCGGRTGHAEVVQVTFDPEVLSFRDLLRVFFATHDPTTLNRQGPDVGTQYRSAIFYHAPEQERMARDVIAEVDASKAWGGKVVTEVTPLDTFWKAEDYHQGYFRNNPTQGYCQAMIGPKLAKLHKLFAGWVRA